MRKLFLLSLTAILSILSFNASAGTTDAEGYPVFYLKGSFNNTNWNANNNYKFTRSGNTYSLTLKGNTAIGECEFKISDDDWAVNYGADVEINASKFVDGVMDGRNMKTNGLSNAVISFDYNNDNSATTKIKFVVDGIEPGNGDDDNKGELVDIYLRGTFSNAGWSSVDSKYQFRREGDICTLVINEQNPIAAGSEFKIASSDWTTIDLGATDTNVYIDNTQSITLTRGGQNLKTANGIKSGSISFTYPADGYVTVGVKFTIDGTDPIEPGPVTGLSGTLPVLYINVYSDEAHTAFNNEIISKDLAHKDYFDYAEYWLDMNGCDWMGKKAENVGSAEEPLPLQIKARGNYTRTGFAKKPFKLKLGSKQALLGLTKSKHFAILAHADDSKGYLRNFTGFNLGKRIGLPWTPDQQPVEVVINGDYRGLYFLTESIRVEEKRVNIVELNDEETDGKLISGGYIVELDNYDEPYESQIVMDEKVANGANVGYVDKLRVTFDTPEVYSDLQRKFITEQFTAMNNYVGQNNDALWSYLDLDDAARYYLVEEIVSHTESYHGSTYLFRDYGDGQKWHFSPLWDFGNAFNGATDRFFYNPGVTPFGNTWIPSFRVNKTFNDKVKATWLWFMSNEYEGLIDDIDTYVAHISAAAKADHERWKSAPVPNGGNSVANNSDMQSRRNEVVNHLNAKINWLKGQFGDYTKGSYSEPARDTTPAAELPDYATTGVEDVVIDNNGNAPIEYYNLQGIRVAAPSPGNIYIIRQGDKTVKQVVR